ncbi:MAG: D-glycero-beta-D-manno-heptose-7-phosphate kinase [Calditrichaceae bacterium]
MISIDKDRIKKIFENFQNKKILVLGDVMIDEYLLGYVNRMSPEAPVPVIEIENELLKFGGAANVALNLKSLGCEPILTGLIGQDRMGDMFMELMRENDMDVNGIIRSGNRPTTVKTRIIGNNQHIARVDKEHREYVAGPVIKEIKQHIDELLRGIDAIVIQDYNKGMLPVEIIEFALEIAKERNIITTVDPKFINFLSYKNTSVFKPNIKEAAQALARVIETDDDVLAAGSELLKILNAGSILLTRGPKGLSLFEANGEISHIPTRARKVADVSGAGDTVISTMTAALVGNASYKEAAYFANSAAGIVCEEVGIVAIEKQRLLNNILDSE